MRAHLVQHDVAWEDPAANRRRVGELLASRGLQPGELVVLPEMFATGFSMDAGRTAEPVAGPTHAFCGDLARNHGVHVLAGIATRHDDGLPRNDAVAFDPAGRAVARFTKLHPYTLGNEGEHYTPGDAVVTFEWGGFCVCPLICYDLRFAGTFRAGLDAGADLFVVIANFPASRQAHWHTLLRARAIEYQAYAVGVNRVGNDPNVTYAGGSAVYDPAGTPVLEADDGEGVHTADLDPRAVTDSRDKFPAWREH